MTDTKNTKHKGSKKKKKFPRSKERILEAAREKVQVTHKGSSMRIAPKLSVERVKARRPGYKVLKDCRRQPRQTATPTGTATTEGETSRGKAALKELTFAKSARQRIQKKQFSVNSLSTHRSTGNK